MGRRTTVLNTGNKWIVYFDKYTEHQYGAIESTDLKSWTDVSDKITLPTGIRHGTILPITNEELNKLLAADGTNAKGDYALIWSDEFNNNSTPDTTIWDQKK